MAPFDPELYLRRLGEDTVLGVTDEQTGFASRLNDAATALVAVEVITPDRAREVLADYAAAEAARDGNGRFLLGRLSARERPITPTPPPVGRMVALGDELEVAGWNVRLRYIALGAESVDIAGVYTSRAATGRANRRLGRAGVPGPLSRPTVADDRGTRLTLDFRGGGSDDRWRSRRHGSSCSIAGSSWSTPPSRPRSRSSRWSRSTWRIATCGAGWRSAAGISLRASSNRRRER